MAELKPCPFCGGPAALGEIAEGHEDYGGQFIACTDPQCGASTNLRFPLMDDAVPLLVEQWNRRVPSNDSVMRPVKVMGGARDGSCNCGTPGVEGRKP